MEILDYALAIFGVVGTSAGFWGYMQARAVRKSAWMRLILGLAHESIVRRGHAYIERGYITSEEYEDYEKYIYTPYSEIGGNGLAEKIFKEVQNLPFRTNHS